MKALRKLNSTSSKKYKLDQYENAIRLLESYDLILFLVLFSWIFDIIDPVPKAL